MGKVVFGALVGSVVAVLIMRAWGSVDCNARWEPLWTKFSATQGCLVKYEGLWYPGHYVRAVLEVKDGEHASELLEHLKSKESTAGVAGNRP